jgi:hypothetical protein
MAIKQDDPRLLWVTILEAVKLLDGDITVYRDHWWVVGEKGILFWSPTAKQTFRHPQCNLSEDIAVRIRNKLFPWADIMKIPVVYRRREE